MKRKGIFAVGWLGASVLLCISHAEAQDAVPCLIFTGNATTEQCIDLAKLNRIAFGEDGMTVSSSKGGSGQEVQLLYSLYNRVKIGDAVPTASAGVGEIEADTDSSLSYDAETKSLTIYSASEKPYSIGIFGMNGLLIATAEVTSGQALPVEALQPGMYVAVASNGESKLSLKFKLN